MTDSKKVSTLIKARWLLTIADDAILDHYYLAIDQGKIVDIGPQQTCKLNAKEIIELDDHVVMPGLINAHGHASMSLFRGLADDLPLMDWLNNHIWPAESRWVDDEFVADGAKLAMAEMILSGTTCFSDMYFFPNMVAKAAADAQMRCELVFPILDFPTNWASTADEYLQKGLQLYDDFRHHDLVVIGFGPHAPYTVSDEPLHKISALAQETNAPIQIHLHETAFEVAEAETKTGMRPIQRLQNLGLLTPQLQAVHMTQMNADDIALAAKSGVHIIHCPESNLKLASGFCPIAELLDAGVNVALGTDSAASNNDLDMFGEMRTAALVAKAVAQNASAVPAKQALAMATINGAKALGIEDVTGTLEIGKAADIIAVKMDAAACTPLHDIASQLVYATPSTQVTDSWIAGKQVMKNRTLTQMDFAAIRAKAAHWAHKIQQTEKQQ